jgi:hypothetical protein
LLPLIFYGSFAGVINQYSGWIHELTVELGNKQDLLAPGNHTLFSVIARYTPVRVLDLHGLTRAVYEFIILSMLAASVLFFMKHSDRMTGKAPVASEIRELGLLTALIPLLAFTDENAFLFLLLSVFALLLYFPAFKNWQKILMAVGLFLVGGNFGEALGQDLSRLINDLSLITFGAIILLGLLFTRQAKGWPTSTS